MDPVLKYPYSPVDRAIASLRLRRGLI
jgi:hypothetical protein